MHRGTEATGGRARCGARARRTALVVLAAAVSAACGAEAEGPRRQARGLAALEIGAARLLPAGVVAAAAPEPRPSQVPAFDRRFVDGLDAAQSWSIGTTSGGYLVGGVPLAAAPGLAPRPVSVRRGAVYGTAAPVSALERAAARVAREWPGSTLYAGDLSAEGGGDLPRHTSHNSGRDVDLAFYALDAAGDLADSPRMAKVGADLRGGDGRRFDLARNWALIEALLTDPEAQVQWVFVASHLRRALLEHAAASGASAEVLRRARAVLKQPGDSSPHAEHFHVRIYCGADERLEGCLDAPPFYPWVRRFDGEVERWVAALLPFLDVGWSEELRFAVTRLVRMNATQALPRLRALAGSDDPRVAALAAEAVAFFEGRPTRQDWARWRIDAGLYD